MSTFTLFVPKDAYEKVMNLQQFSENEKEEQIEKILDQFTRATSLRAILQNIQKYPVEEHEGDEWVLKDPQHEGIAFSDTTMSIIQEMLGNNLIQHYQETMLENAVHQMASLIKQQLTPILQQTQSLQNQVSTLQSAQIIHDFIEKEEQRRATRVHQHNVADGLLAPVPKRPRCETIIRKPECSVDSLNTPAFYETYRGAKNLTVAVIRLLRLHIYVDATDRIREAVQAIAFKFFRIEYMSQYDNALLYRGGCKRTEYTPLVYTNLEGEDLEALVFHIAYWIVVDSASRWRAPVWPLALDRLLSRYIKRDKGRQQVATHNALCSGPIRRCCCSCLRHESISVFAQPSKSLTTETTSIYTSKCRRQQHHPGLQRVSHKADY